LNVVLKNAALLMSTESKPLARVSTFVILVVVVLIALLGLGCGPPF
jgi:hypothetical protein